MQSSLLEPDKNAKSGLSGLLALAGLTLLVSMGVSWVVPLFGVNWLPAAEIIFFFIPGAIFAGLSFGDFTSPKSLSLLVAVFAGLGAGILSHFLLPYWHQVFSAPQAYDQALRSYLHLGWWPGFVIDMVRAALVPAVCEELFFRGLIFSKLQQTHSLRLAFFVSAVFFALAHGVAVYFPLYFLIGLGAAAIYRAYGLTAAILAHVAFNAVGLVIWQLG